MAAEMCSIGFRVPQELKLEIEAAFMKDRTSSSKEEFYQKALQDRCNKINGKAAGR